MNSLELALAIAIPVTLGVLLLVAIPFLVKRYRRRNQKKRQFNNVDVEKAIWGHTRNLSETNKPLLSKSESSFSPEQEDDFPLPSPDRNTSFVFPAPHALPSNPQPFYAPPPPRGDVNSSLPVVDRFPRQPGRSPLSQVQNLALSPPTQPILPAPLPAVRHIPASLQPRSPPLPQMPSRSRQEQGPMLPPSLSRSKTTELLRQPSYLTQPREAPAFPGPQRTRSRRRPQPTLARIATTRSTRNYRAQVQAQAQVEEEQAPIPGSPVSTASIYSQSSATTSVWNGLEQPWNSNRDVPPIPGLPTVPASPPSAFGHSGDMTESSSGNYGLRVNHDSKRDSTTHSISDSFRSDTYFDEEEEEGHEALSPSRLLTESPLQYDPFWSHVLNNNVDHKPLPSDLKDPAIRTNPESIPSHPPKQVSDPSMTYSVPVYGVVKEGKQKVYDRWEAIPITPVR